MEFLPLCIMMKVMGLEDVVKATLWTLAIPLYGAKTPSQFLISPMILREGPDSGMGILSC